MTTKLVTAIASAMLAATALASAAEAGGDGVRVPFGFPLGSFKATPAHGGGAVATPRARKAPAHREAYAPSKAGPRIRKPAATAATEPAATATVESAATAVVEEAPRVTGSSALIQSSIPDQSSEAEIPADDVKAEVPAAASQPAVTASTDHSGKVPDVCKKFVPAIGTTVTVGCEP